MIKYHPDSRFLTDYAAGTLPESQALCVATHLHYCPSCKAAVNTLAALGGELLLAQEPAPLAAGSFDTVMARIAQLKHATDKDADATPAPGTAQRTVNPTESFAAQLPPVLEKLAGRQLEKLAWRGIGKALRYAPVRTGENRRERCDTTLLHIQPGGSIPDHGHRGEEITVVLRGSFSDVDDRYNVGDFVLRTPGDTHLPVASQDENCLCLLSMAAPVIMRNPLYRLLMPLFYRPVN